MSNSDDSGYVVPTKIAYSILVFVACLVLCGVFYISGSFIDGNDRADSLPTPSKERPIPTRETSQSILLSALINAGCAKVTYYWGKDSRVFRPETGIVCEGKNFHIGNDDVPYDIKTATIVVDCFGTWCTCVIQINRIFVESGEGDNHAVCTWDK